MAAKILSKALTIVIAGLTALGLISCGKKLSTEDINKLYATGVSAPTKSLNVYHLGHSLVGVDMPTMFQQLAGKGHEFKSQLGWGATLKSHFEPDEPISGFEESNSHGNYRDAYEAIASQEYDAFVMTEMVEIEAAIKYFNSAKYVQKFAQKIADESPNTTIYLYETWHEVTDPKGWINRLDDDLAHFWEEQILYKALAKLDGAATIYMIPAGQVMSAFFKEVEKRGGVGNISSPEDIFARTEDGGLDPIHINDLGSYLVALVHYAVLYQKSPEGLPHQLTKADGSAALAPTLETAQLMQEITWLVVSKYSKSGVRAP